LPRAVRRGAVRTVVEFTHRPGHAALGGEGSGVRHRVDRGGRDDQPAADLGPELSANTRTVQLPSLLSREDDPVARDVVEGLARVQTSVPVARWTLSSFFDVASQEPDLSDWADSMRARYVDVPRSA
jgi:hypothetical protein